MAEPIACPCKKKSCERHGDCAACRKHHAGSKRQRPVACERRENRKRSGAAAAHL